MILATVILDALGDTPLLSSRTCLPAALSVSASPPGPAARSQWIPGGGARRRAWEERAAWEATGATLTLDGPARRPLILYVARGPDPERQWGRAAARRDGLIMMFVASEPVPDCRQAFISRTPAPGHGPRPAPMVFLYDRPGSTACFMPLRLRAFVRQYTSTPHCASQSQVSTPGDSIHKRREIPRGPFLPVSSPRLHAVALLQQETRRAVVISSPAPPRPEPR